MELENVSENATPKCKCCKEQVEPSDAFCSNCGFPLQGTDEEKSKFIGQYLTQKNERVEWSRQVRNARTTLIVVGVLTIIGGFALMAIQNNMLGNESGSFVLILSLIVAAMYFFLAWWSSKNPFVAILSGLVIFVSLQIVNIALDPSSIIQGVLVKVIVIVYLAKGLAGASKVRNFSK